MNQIISLMYSMETKHDIPTDWLDEIIFLMVKNWFKLQISVRKGFTFPKIEEFGKMGENWQKWSTFWLKNKMFFLCFKTIFHYY